MANENLSQKDIDVLLSEIHVSPERPQEVTETSDRTVFKYNFQSQKKIKKGHVLLLENIHKRFLRNIEGSLTNLLNIPVISELTTATEVRYKEFSGAISSPSCLFLLNVLPIQGHFVIEVELKFAFFVIDKVLGGSSNGDSPPNRELSLIEERIMHRAISLFLKDLEDAWEAVEPVKFEPEAFYAQSDYIQVIGAEERIFLVSVDIRGDKEIGFINLCMPIAILEHLISKNHAEQPTSRFTRTEEDIIEDRTLVTQNIKNAKVLVKAILGQANVMMNDLMLMQPGDVICLDTKKGRPCDIVVENRRMYKGLPFKNENFVNIVISS